MKYIKLLLLLIFSQSLQSHPYHHTLAIFDENQATKQLELSFKMLSEDYALLSKDKNMQDYLNKHLTLTVVDHQLIGEYQGMEADVNYTWLYFTYEINDDWIRATEISVINTVLINVNDKQVNTVNMNSTAQRSSYNFTAANRDHQFIK